jgi:hypothetical protein
VVLSLPFNEIIRLCKCLPYRPCLKYTACLRVGEIINYKKCLRRLLFIAGLGLLCLTPLATILQLYRGCKFYCMSYYYGWNRLLTRGRHLCDRIISLNGEVSTHANSLTPSLSTEVFLPIRESDWSCMCGRCIHVASLNDFVIGFWKCCCSVVFLVFHFITMSLIHLKQ